MSRRIQGAVDPVHDADLVLVRERLEPGFDDLDRLLRVVSDQTLVVRAQSCERTDLRRVDRRRRSVVPHIVLGPLLLLTSCRKQENDLVLDTCRLCLPLRSISF